jgi:hypothetical protein
MDAGDLLLEEDQSGPIHHLAASFSNFSVRPSQIPRTRRVIQKAVWVIYDRKEVRRACVGNQGSRG